MSAPGRSLAAWTRRWHALAGRERLALAAMAAVLALALAWLVAVRPAWRTLAQAPARRAQLEAQSLSMQNLGAEARELRALPPLPPTQARQGLKTATDRLGAKARLQMTGDDATVALTGIGGEELRQWLADVRGSARARPVELQLVRHGEVYEGSVTLSLAAASASRDGR